MKDAQKGFAVTRLLLLIVFLLLLAGAGVFVWGNLSNDKTKSVYKAPSAQSAVTKDLGNGTIEYKNAQVGVQFVYPKLWGAAQTTQGPNGTYLAAGAEFVISFTNNTSVTGAVKSADWKYRANAPAKGGDPLSAPNYVATYASFKEYKPLTQFQDSTSFIVNIPFEGEGCSGTGEVMVKTITGNTAYPRIAFMYIEKLPDETTYDKETKQESPTENTCSAAAVTKYASKAHITELKTLSRSIKNLAQSP